MSLEPLACTIIHIRVFLAFQNAIESFKCVGHQLYNIIRLARAVLVHDTHNAEIRLVVATMRDKKQVAKILLCKMRFFDAYVRVHLAKVGGVEEPHKPQNVEHVIGAGTIPKEARKLVGLFAHSLLHGTAGAANAVDLDKSVAIELRHAKGVAVVHCRQNDEKARGVQCF